MRHPIDLNSLFATEKTEIPRQLESFALLSLGVIESLAAGSLDPQKSIKFFFNAENGRYVRKLKNKIADEIMGRGMQLADLFDVMPVSEAQNEFDNELETMRGLCARLLKTRKLVA